MQVRAGYNALIVTRNFITRSIFVGAQVGRFFGIHDDELRGWSRAGTLPPNRRAITYNVIPQEDEQSLSVAITPPSRSPPEEPSPAAAERRRGRVGRFTDNVTATIRRRRRRDPTRDEVMKTLPTFWPVMTLLIVVVEVGLLVAAIVTNGLAPIRFNPETISEVVKGFDGEEEFVSKEVVPNFFIGTSKGALVHTGAMYTPVSQHGCSIIWFFMALHLICSLLCSACERMRTSR